MNSGGDDSPPRMDHRTTSEILRRAAVTCFSLLPTFLFLSLLIFSFRTLVENGTVFVTSFLDRDPSLRSLLSRLDLAARNANPNRPHSPSSSSDSLSSFRHQYHHRRRHRPFLHLTRVGTLDDDFFSGDDDDDRSLFGYYRKARVNSSSLRLSNFNPKLGFSGFVVDHGVRFSEVVRPGVSFKIDESENVETDDVGSNDLSDESGRGIEEKENIVDLRFFVAGLELGRRDAAALFFLVSVLSAAYGWVILGFVITYSWVLGIVFISVVNDFLGRYTSFAETVWSGSNLGVKRLSGFILMRWAVRDALTQILGLWFFGEIDDQYSFFKLFLRLKLMPFSVSSPWVSGYDKEVSGFLFAWFLVDTLVAFVFAVDSWVTIVSTRRGGREIIKEGLYLLATMIHQSIQLKCLELILCGAFTRWVLARLFGKSFAVIFQSLVEVYFMVAWLVFYLAARYKDANLSGRRFGRRELEALIEGLR